MEFRRCEFNQNGTVTTAPLTVDARPDAHPVAEEGAAEPTAARAASIAAMRSSMSDDRSGFAARNAEAACRGAGHAGMRA